MRFTYLTWALVLGLCPSLSFAQDRALKDAPAYTSRIALLIGNGTYQDTPSSPDMKTLPKLKNPCNDITQISAVLEAAGWNPQTEIISICDAKRSQLRDAIDRFKDVYLPAERALGFIYYSGHGLQLGNDTYLFGVDSELNVAKAAGTVAAHAEGNVFKGGVRLFNDLIGQIGRAGAGSIFIVVDACRETPIDQFIRAQPGTANGYLQLAFKYPRPVQGVKLLYSTSYGNLASDGAGGGSPFAIEFVKHLKQEGRIEYLVSRVVDAVEKGTAGSALPQLPDTTGALSPPPPESCLTRCGVSQ